MTEYKFKPFIEEFGETKQKGVTRRPYTEKIGYGKEFQIYAKLNSEAIRVVWDWRKSK